MASLPRRNKRMHRIGALRSPPTTDNPLPAEVLRQHGSNLRQPVQTVLEGHRLLRSQPLFAEEQGDLAGVDSQDTGFKE